MSHKCEAIVVHCMDYRLQSYINNWLEANLGKGSYDRAVMAELAGAVQGKVRFLVAQIAKEGTSILVVEQFARTVLGVADIAASFQEAVVDTLVTKLGLAADVCDARTLVIGGGVAANSRLRTGVLDLALETGRQARLPSFAMCTDNAAMIGAAAYHRLLADGPTGLDGGATPNLRLASTR